MLSNRELEVIYWALEGALNDPGTIDTTSGGGCSQQEKAELLAEMKATQDKVKDELGKHIPGEGKLRQELIRRYVDRFGHLYARLEFHPNGTTYHPAINSTPADVARWLVEVAGDILKLED